MLGILDEFADIAPIFSWYMKGVAAGYRQNSFQKEGRLEVLNATKSLASYRIAKLLNMQNLIVNTRWAKVTTEHGETFGVICDEAAGKRALDCCVKITPSLQRELSDLNVLDAICYQRDHGPNNYNIWFDENDTHICAFDNDNPTTFLVTHKLPQNASGNVSPIIRRGLFNRPHVSRSAVDAMNNVTFIQLVNELHSVLSLIEIASVWIRLNRVKKSIRRTQEKKTDFILDNTEWNQYTIAEELSNQYGKTYLTILENLCFKA